MKTSRRRSERYGSLFRKRSLKKSRWRENTHGTCGVAVPPLAVRGTTGSQPALFWRRWLEGGCGPGGGLLGTPPRRLVQAAAVGDHRCEGRCRVQFQPDPPQHTNRRLGDYMEEWPSHQRAVSITQSGSITFNRPGRWAHSVHAANPHGHPRLVGSVLVNQAAEAATRRGGLPCFWCLRVLLVLRLRG